MPCKLSHSDAQPDPTWGPHGCVAAYSSVKVHKQAPPHMVSPDHSQTTQVGC